MPPKPITVKLITATEGNPLEVASHAARVCYNPNPPKMGDLIGVKDALFATGHHTTLQHFFLTFFIDGVGVGPITQGIHFSHPFYNTDQRSGRFCAQMFLNPDFAKIQRYITTFWPSLKKQPKKLERIMGFIKKGVNLYHQNIDAATEIAAEFIAKDRPNANEKYIAQNAPKIAQEQIRMFIPVIFPTGLDFTINLTVLAAMYRTAWDPVVQYIVKEMVRLTLKNYPELAFMFPKEDANNQYWAMAIPKASSLGIKISPSCKLLDIVGIKSFTPPKSQDMHPVDLLHFRPEYMNNSWGEIQSEVEISLATMGQDQRHRTIRRSQPAFTGKFYLPPIVKKLGLEKEALKLMKQWVSVSKAIPPTLAQTLAPYGAMVRYKKAGSFNAICHELNKRLCWCAQEEISEIGRKLRRAIQKKLGKNHPLVKMLEPICYSAGKCGEGRRYCGRDISLRKKGEDYFPKRRV